jgi:hypothetical protein
VPEPGGWNRIQLEVDDLADEVEAIRDAGARFRNEIVEGRGGKESRRRLRSREKPQPRRRRGVKM